MIPNRGANHPASIYSSTVMIRNAHSLSCGYAALKEIPAGTVIPSGTCRVLSPESTTSQAVLGVFQGTTVNANTAYLTE